MENPLICRYHVYSRTRTYAEAVVEVATAHSVPCVNAFEGLEGSTDNRAKYFIDGLHFNDRYDIQLYACFIAVICLVVYMLRLYIV